MPTGNIETEEQPTLAIERITRSSGNSSSIEDTPLPRRSCSSNSNTVNYG